MNTILFKVVLTLVIFLIISFIGINVASSIYTIKFMDKYEKFVDAIYASEDSEKEARKKLTRIIQISFTNDFFKWFFGIQ